jgi:hypothetical protein
VSSPFRNPLKRVERLAQRIAASRVGEAGARLVAFAAGVRPPIVRWRRLEGLTFDNQVGTLEVRGREILLRIEKAVSADTPEQVGLERLWERRLAPAPRRPEQMPKDTDGAPADVADPAPAAAEPESAVVR